MIIRDNQSESKDNFFEIEKLVREVADKTLEQLQNDGILVFPPIIKDSDDLTKDQMILRSKNTEYCSGNVMGFIGFKKERLQIRSRFDGENDFFFQYLLGKIFCPNIFDLKTVSDWTEGTFDYLLFLFPYYLKTALRKGVYKKYIWKKLK